MNCANIKIRLANSLRLELSPVEIEAVADGTQPFLLLPVRLAARLRLEAIDTRFIAGEDRKYSTCPYVGPVTIQLGGQSCFTGAVVSGSRVRIGSIALASMNLVVDPTTQKVMTDPAGPPRLTRFSVQGQ